MPYQQDGYVFIQHCPFVDGYMDKKDSEQSRKIEEDEVISEICSHCLIEVVKSSYLVAILLMTKFDKCVINLYFGDKQEHPIILRRCRQNYEST